MALAAAGLVVAGCSPEPEGRTPQPVAVRFEMDPPNPGTTTASGRPLPTPSVALAKVEVVRTDNGAVVERLTVDGGEPVQVSLPPGDYLVRAAPGHDTPSRPMPFTVVPGEQDTVVNLPTPAWGIDPPPTQ